MRHAVWHPDDVTGSGTPEDPIEPEKAARRVVYDEHPGECDGCRKPESLRSASDRAEYEDAIRALIDQDGNGVHVEGEA